MDLVIRDIRSADLPEIKDIIDETWDWEDLFETQEALEATLGLYLNMVLYKSSFTKAAELDGKLVGVITGYVEGDEPMGRLLMDDGALYALKLMNTIKSDRKATYKYLSKTQDIYKEMLEEVGEPYDANLVFFVVSEEVRGLNVGKRLWLELLSYFKQKGVRSVYLFSDTECNFGFYDHAGFTKRTEREVEFTFGGEPEDFSQTIFLYDYKLD